MQFSAAEEKILRFWQKNKIFAKSLAQNKGKKPFVFFEGPPTANGRPGIHHVEARAFKDIIPRYKTMRGFWVERKAGWDTHGLPVEIQVEKELGLKNKKDIEKYGVAKFNQKCRESVWRHKDEWEKLTQRIGFWIDLRDPYITYENYYIESVWQIIKRVWDRGLIYKGFKIVPHCPRCSTGLSSHEVAQGYKKIRENSIYVKFPVEGEKNTYFLVWTTTPWTLPANMALAVGKNISYTILETRTALNRGISSGRMYLTPGRYIVATARIKDLIREGNYFTGPKKEIRGKDLIGKKYQPLFRSSQANNNSYKVISADFVSTKEGTGIVHIAPAYGIDDMETGKREKLPVAHTVNTEGLVIPNLGIPGERKFIKEADKDIISFLKNKKLLLAENLHEHDYPFCWRCDTPLLYYAKDSWFIKMSALRAKLIKNNQQINWEPTYIKNGRFGEFVAEAKDWALSRERFWGTPLPIWTCEACGTQRCVGSAKELKNAPKDLHRPFIDEVKLKCACGGEMTREKDVLDVWFDSGSMPFAQWGFPGRAGSAVKLKKHYPADFISEAIDQTRGWFYTLLAIATLMEECGVVKSGVPYKNVICLGHVLDARGKKMSKSKGNVVDPWEMCKQFGADTLRWYLYTVNQAGDPKKFDVKDVADKNRRVFSTLRNALLFWQTYGDSKFRPQKLVSQNVLDRWVLTAWSELNKQVINNLEKYDVVTAARLLENFVDDFSNWYIRRSRERFQKPKDQKEKEAAAQTFYFVLFNFAKLLAPFAPFIAEEIYQQLKNRKDPLSVHLCAYPQPDKKTLAKNLLAKMTLTRAVVAAALSKRAEAGIKIRQPLASLTIKEKLGKEFLALIADEVNIKMVKAGRQFKLDTKITKQLQQEGDKREIERAYAQLRKELGLRPGDLVAKIAFSDPRFIEGEKTAAWRAHKFAIFSVKEKYQGTKEVPVAGGTLKIGVKK